MIGVCLFLCTDGAAYATLRYRLGDRLPLGQVGLVLNQIWGPSLVLFVVAVLLFPDGRLTSQFWRWTFRVYGVLFGVLLAATAVAIAGALSAHPVRVDNNGGLAAVDQQAGWFAVVQSLLIVSMLGLSLAFIARLALSWRRATGERRQQLKWLATGATVSLVCLGLAGTFSSSGNGPTLRGVLTGIAWLGVAALPVSIGVAIMKYRLYDIDRIISRTLAYAIITGLLAGVYAGLVLLTTQVFGVHTPVAVAASTLAAAALFSPLRRRVQRAVDRRFNRARNPPTYRCGSANATESGFRQLRRRQARPRVMVSPSCACSKDVSWGTSSMSADMWVRMMRRAVSWSRWA